MSRTVTTINPATGEALQTDDAAGLDDVLDILEAVHTAQPGWAALPGEQRADHLRAIGARLRKQRDELAALLAAEMGKPVAEARAEVEKSATACDYYAENGPAALAPQNVDTGSQRSWLRPGHREAVL
jgi:succinate-semialdehyde dehydrogenase/glutarate-semialdehyde dehydrogenase